MEEELALNDADPSNAVSKKCKHGVKTLVDTIVDQPGQYGNVVIMSYGGYYDGYLHTENMREYSHKEVDLLSCVVIMSQALYMGIHSNIKDN